jgi:tetratricopeptide (TPR) repeat protein
VASDGFVGRGVALARLRRDVDDAVAGRGGLDLVVGEAGIGKTALAGEVARHAAARDAELLWATCRDGDGAPAYWPWVQVLRDHAERHGRLTGDVARLMPDADESAGGLMFATLGDGGGDRFPLFDAVSSMFLRVARVRSLFIVIDDLQWADVPSLLLLDFFASRLATAPILILGLFRDEETGLDPSRRAALGEVRRKAHVIALTGLEHADVGALMESVAGSSPDSALVANVARRTAGNPFFVREVTQLMVNRGGLGEGAGSGSGIPEGVREVVRQRLARLSQACVSILAVAAVIGREAGSDLLARVAGCDMDVAIAQMEAAFRARVLARPPGPSGPYRFGHDLFRETLYDGLEPGERARLHLDVAVAMEETSTGLFAGRSSELARHYLLAAVGHPELPAAAEKAARFCMLAAAEAGERLAHEDAVEHYRRTLDGLALAGLLSEAAQLDLLLGRADALRRAGEAAAARCDYREATELARGSGSVVHFARVALGIHALGVESGAPRDACIELLEEALERLGDDDSAPKARVLACLARELYLSGVADRRRAARLSSDAVDIARRVGDDATLAACLLAAHDTIWLPGTAAKRRLIAAEMATVARRAHDRAFEAEAWLLRASAGWELGEPTASADLDTFIELGTAVGQPHFAYLVLTRRAARATMSGRFAEAEQLIAEAAELASSIGEPDAWNVQTRLVWELRSAQGRRAEAETLVRNNILPQLKYWYDALAGLALLARGDRAEALRGIRPAVEARPEDLPFPYVVAAQWAELGEAAAAAGLTEPCRRFYDALRPHAGTVVVVAAAVGFGGAVDHHLGVLAAALGRLDDAARHLESGAVLHEQMSAWPWLARTRCELAAVLAARGRPVDRERTTRLLDEARAAAREFGMTGLIRRLDEIALAPENVFRHEGDTWRISFAGREIRVREAKGFADIAALLRAEGREVPATVLAGSRRPDLVEFGADPVLDHRAQQQYRSRLMELDDELAEADSNHDLGRAAAVSDERAFIARELASAVGLGRDRGLGDDRERARKAVTARIKDALHRIEERHPALGAHLRQSISTGNHCSYHPAEPVRWRA